MLIISRFFGILIIFGSIFVKVPQIVKIMRARSGYGISIASQTIELIAATATGAYGYGNSLPFSSYGEVVFSTLQTATICYLIWYYHGRRTKAMIFVAFYFAAVLLIFQDIIPLSLLQWILMINVPLGLSSTAIQIFKNFQNESAGQLSPTTAGLCLFGSLTRIFTSIFDADDYLLCFSYCMTSLLLGVLLGQIILYARKKKVT